MTRQCRRGESLIELLVALVLLEIAGAAALAAALTAERLERRIDRGSADDVSRWEAYRARELEPSCRSAAEPDTGQEVFVATPERPALALVVRCGP